MNEIIDQNTPIEGSDDGTPQQERLLATGGILAALLASSCCVAPLVLVTLGVGGAWVGNLTALAPYKLYFLVLTAMLLMGGFWHVYFKPKKVCEDGSYCARPSSSLITKSALWGATALALPSATIEFWAPLFY